MPRRSRNGYIKAIPTSFNGVKYRSRLEARFAEMLTEQGLEFKYEKPFPDNRQGYIPDFFIPRYRLYVEIKPEACLKELDIFMPGIRASRHRWMCIDKLGRDSWIRLRSNFLGDDIVYGRCRVELSKDQIRLFPEHVDLLPAEEKPAVVVQDVSEVKKMTPEELETSKRVVARFLSRVRISGKAMEL